MNKHFRSLSMSAPGTGGDGDDQTGKPAQPGTSAPAKPGQGNTEGEGDSKS